MLFALAWQDHLVIAVYLAAMIAMGAWFSRRQRTDEEYFLGGRRMPWFPVGISIIASLLSAITYLAEPGEVWHSGVMHMAGKLLAVPFEMVFVWLFCIPFLMRFRFTSAYEYLGERFNGGVRIGGVILFLCYAVSWMGVMVLVSSRTLSVVTGLPLYLVIGTLGAVATVYTVLGGLRAVIWTDVCQVVLLIGGASFAVIYVAMQTGSGPAEWYRAVTEGANKQPIFVSLDPRVRATILTVAVHMFVWHVCTHTANQMTVQRYFSTADTRAARRSFVVASILGAGLNILLMLVGMAVFYYYALEPALLPAGIDTSVGKETDQIFAYFIVERLPAGIAGGVLAALLAATMSSIDSGINSIATVLTVQWRSRQQRFTSPQSASGGNEPKQHVRFAQLLTLIGGVSITLAAIGLDRWTGQWNIVDMMPRSFNCFTGAMGGLFFIGMFMRRAGSQTALIAAACGLATSFAIAYSKELFALDPPISFTWIMPGSLAVTLAVAWILSRFEPVDKHAAEGWTWYSRRREPVIREMPEPVDATT